MLIILSIKNPHKLQRQNLHRRLFFRDWFRDAVDSVSCGANCEDVESRRRSWYVRSTQNNFRNVLQQKISFWEKKLFFSAILNTYWWMLIRFKEIFTKIQFRFSRSRKKTVDERKKKNSIDTSSPVVKREWALSSVIPLDTAQWQWMNNKKSDVCYQRFVRVENNFRDWFNQSPVKMTTRLKVFVILFLLNVIVVHGFSVIPTYTMIELIHNSELKSFHEKNVYAYR